MHDVKARWAQPAPGNLDRQESDSQEVPNALISDGFSLPDLDADEGDAPPPAYGELPDQLHFNPPGFEAGAVVTDDGRVNININQKNSRLSELLAPTLRNQLLSDKVSRAPLPPAYIPPSLGGQPGQTPPPQLNVVIQIVGSRGDVQPFVALGKVLKETYGHRVRIATHATFQSFVEENGLEFFSIGGDPAELMAFMVKNPGLMPGIDALKSGEITKRRKGMQDILLGCWRSCIEAGDGLGPPPKPHAKDEPLNTDRGLPGEPGAKPFVADAIIANPPSFAHIHIAEKLGIPLHLMFTMPWSPTRAFPHPLANIQSSNTDVVMTNYLSYALVEMMTWQGLGDVINRFRSKALDLEPLSLIWAPGLLTRLRVSYTYCWSPALIPKPNDWGNEIDISGFFFLNLASAFTPDPDLAEFLAAGPPPVYIGFGSIVVEDPNALTRLIFDAIHLAGVRALVSKGWGGLGADSVGLPEGVFMLGNVPHDWLFKHVSAVVHHGGAGTTAAGINAGKPTFVVPFFGDQPFWGAMVAKAGAGPDPVPFKDLNAEKFAKALEYLLKPETQNRAQELGQKIREEKGTDVGGKSFHDHLDVDSLRCSIAPSRAAVWRVRRTQIRLSPMAAATLVKTGILNYTDLKLYRSQEYSTEGQPWDPISAAAASLVADLGSIAMSIADFPRDVFKAHSKARVDSRSRAGSSPSESQKMSMTASDDASVRPPRLPRSDSASQHIVELPGDTPISPATDLPPTPMMTPALTVSTPNASSLSLVTQNETSATSEPENDLVSTPPGTSKKDQKKPIRGDASPSRMENMTTGASIEAAMAAGSSVGRIMSAGAKTPMNFCLGVARGFRNVPRLYNDDMVRPTEKVTDFTSGLRVAGKEFAYGLYDGVGGLVIQPWKGAEKEGGVGLVKGVGKGLGGFFFKNAAALWSIPAYTMQGVHASLRNAFGSSVQNYIITSRIVQGEFELKDSGVEEQQEVIKRWNNIRFDLKNFYALKIKEQKDKEKPSASETEPGLMPVRTGWAHTKGMSFDERKKLHARKEAWKKGHVETTIPELGDTSSIPDTSSRPGTSSRPSSAAEDAEFERAIQESVAQTSQGNAEEDARIEAAIRASVNLLRSSGQPLPGLPGTQADSSPRKEDDVDLQITDEEYQLLVEQAIQQSMALQAAGHEPDDSEEDIKRALQESQAVPPPPTYDDDEAIMRAIEESKAQHQQAGVTDDDDEELRRAIAESQSAHREEVSAMTEEDIVLEYVKKQSLAEEEFRRQQVAKGKMQASGDADLDDEELRKAIEESLMLAGRGGAGPSGPR